MQILVARQPIFDRQRQVYGYELLFRSESHPAEFDGRDSTAASTQLIADSLLGIGLHSLLLGKKAFINFDKNLLVGGLHSVLPPEILVIEVLESVKADGEVIQACRNLRQQGYELALDDFVPGSQPDALVRMANVIKVDVLQTPPAEQERLIRMYRPLGIAMLAEKVETPEVFEWALAAGYDYFQGYFFARPATITRARIPAGRFSCLRLLAAVHEEQLDLGHVEALVCGDVWLSYSMLMYVNSPLFWRTAKVVSIQHALALLGEEGIRRWAVLATVPVMVKDRPGELVMMSLARARFCEQLSQLTGMMPANLAFLMGLFSLLDALTDLSMEEALAQIKAAPDLADALTGQAPPGDPRRDLLQLACRYEAGDWEKVAALAQHLRVATSRIAEAYTEAAFWAQQALHATCRKANTRRHIRWSFEGKLRLLWADAPGGEGFISATLKNVSPAGLQLVVTEKVPVRSQVRCHDLKLGISGQGHVRYCNYEKGKYIVGVEFRAGTGWREAPALAKRAH